MAKPEDYDAQAWRDRLRRKFAHARKAEDIFGRPVRGARINDDGSVSIRFSEPVRRTVQRPLEP